MDLKGVYTALITPFKEGTLDEEGLKRMIEFQLRGGVDGIVPCGIQDAGVTSIARLKGRF